jgi:hypothetical protein
MGHVLENEIVVAILAGDNLEVFLQLADVVTLEANESQCGQNWDHALLEDVVDQSSVWRRSLE